MRRIGRLAGIPALVMAVGLVGGAPAAAATDTWYVGPGPLGGGSCASPDRATIQAAIDVAGSGDTILVCPGTYPEQLTVSTSGLTIRATEPWKARIQPPAFHSPSEFALVRIDGADGVTLQGLSLVQRSSAVGCAGVDFMILVTDGATDTTIRANRIRAAGSDTLGACGYLDGIRIEKGSSATVRYNLIVDFISYGVFVGTVGDTDPAVSATVARNSIRYFHPTQPDDIDGTGIAVYNAAFAKVRGNAISSLATAVGDTPTTPRLEYGIYVFNPANGTVVRDTRVRNVEDGMSVTTDGTLIIRDNTIESFEDYGFNINGMSGGRIAGNTASGGTYGLYLQGTTSGIEVTGNTALGNSDYDCVDDEGDPVDSTWTGNVGVLQYPDGICSAL